MKKLNGTQIKYLMGFLMVFDHLHYLPNFLPLLWVSVFHALTRCVAVWFAFNAVEAFFHTSNLKAYLTRLYGCSLLMATGNFLLNWIFEYKGIVLTNNIFLTLAVGVTLLTLFFKPFKGKEMWSYLLGVLLFFPALFLVEGGIVILLFMLITAGLRQKKRLRNLAYLALSFLLLLMSFQLYDTWAVTLEMLLFNSDFLFITVLPFLALYNGEQGKKTRFNQYFFYIFYPAHLWLLALIAALLSK
ncbi:TraX family protein [Streptococcus oricebi]|uniref:Beta-carotene 15,15'-monooxygenase n=1 Tax=Streptococcus oricebi TaxID=1547447 RepID=A0ABS5B1D7_9STRE|nr:TraX family protein [Streptococcus oricebi]MBP2622643.1 beta-carotene 15,15'-monooxygenase [Streptococcus oricebi]